MEVEGKKVRCEQVQITLKTRSRQQKDIPQIDFFQIYGDPSVFLETATYFIEIP